VRRATLLVVLQGTAVSYGFIRTTSASGRFFWSRGQRLFHDLAASALHRNWVSSIHMWWRMTASFLATAITALL
jgi:hypothetical protein